MPASSKRSLVRGVTEVALSALLCGLVALPIALYQARMDPQLVDNNKVMWEVNVLAMIGGSLALFRSMKLAQGCLGCLLFPIMIMILGSVANSLTGQTHQLAATWLGWSLTSLLVYAGSLVRVSSDDAS